MLYLVYFVLLTFIFAEDTPDVQSFIKDNATFWAADDYQMYYMNEIAAWNKTNSPSITRVSLNGSGNVVGMAYDYHAKQLITTDTTFKQIVLIDLESQRATPLHVGTSKDIGQVAIDWKSRNVYWADGGYGWIAMKAIPNDIGTVNSLDPHFKLLVDKYLDKPTGIAVHLEKNFLFWADAGVDTKIERSNLIGGERMLITQFGLIQPITLCIYNNKLYWSDKSRGTIEFSDFDGSNRKVFASDPSIAFYGIAVFQDIVIFTAPENKWTGIISQEHRTIDSVIITQVPYYHVIVYDKDAQPRLNEPCDSVHFNCSNICVDRQDDAGATCLCEDGLTLEPDGKTCETDRKKVLERHLLFTKDSSICSIAINFINSRDQGLFKRDCDVVNHDSAITRFAIDAARDLIYFTDDHNIFKQTTHENGSEKILNRSGNIFDLDYDWKSQELFWSETGSGVLYYMSVGETIGGINNKDLSDTGIRNIAVDPHNSHIYWITKTDDRSDASLYVWDRPADTVEQLKTVLMKTPTDLEYDRINDRLLWNDDSGFIGSINTDGTKETKIYVYADNSDTKLALTVFKKFIIGTTEENKQFDILYERDNTFANIDIAEDSKHILDMHVFDSTLQPLDLERCDINNGGCEHICLTNGGQQKCTCNLGYSIDSNGETCSTDSNDANSYTVLDSQHQNMYQVGIAWDEINIIEIDEQNMPSSFAFDSTRNEVIWVDQQSSSLVKKKTLGGPNLGTVIGTTVTAESHVAVDVTGGNVYVSSGNKILLFDISDNIKTIVNRNEGTISKIALMAKYGIMAYFVDNVRLVISNMDGSNSKEITEDIEQPEDIAFDVDDGDDFYWCDSKLDKIEKVDKSSLARKTINSGQKHNPVALDVAGEYVFFIPQNQRKIIRLRKTDGSDLEIVFESPLFGILVGLYVSKSNLSGHEVCGSCNGGCSTICLPKGLSKTCTCADNTQLLSDGNTCQHAGVCQAIGTSGGFGGFSPNCCPDLPNEVCQPICSEGYSIKQTEARCLSSGWSHAADQLCEKEKEPLPIAIIAGAGGGGLVLIIIVVVVICVVKRRHDSRYKDSQRRPTLPTVVEINPGFTRPERNPYDDGDGEEGIEPPKRRNETDEEKEVYDYINDDDVGKRVNLPDKSEDRRSSTKDRYSEFPGDPDNGGYLTANYSGAGKPPPQPVPHTDDRKYFEFRQRNTMDLTHQPTGESDGYMVSGGSRQQAGMDRRSYRRNGSMSEDESEFSYGYKPRRDGENGRLSGSNNGDWRGVQSRYQRDSDESSNPSGGSFWRHEMAQNPGGSMPLVDLANRGQNDGKVSYRH